MTSTPARSLDGEGNFTAIVDVSSPSCCCCQIMQKKKHFLLVIFKPKRAEMKKVHNGM